jgi:hypothetical protein
MTHERRRSEPIDRSGALGQRTPAFVIMWAGPHPELATFDACAAPDALGTMSAIRASVDMTRILRISSSTFTARAQFPEPHDSAPRALGTRRCGIYALQWVDAMGYFFAVQRHPLFTRSNRLVT